MPKRGKQGTKLKPKQGPLTMEERRHLLGITSYGEEADNTERVSQHDDSLPKRKLTLWICVAALMVIIIFGWYRTVGNAVKVVPKATVSEDSKSWDEFKEEVGKLYADASLDVSKDMEELFSASDGTDTLDTSAWPKYSSKTHGIEFQYPGAWFLESVEGMPGVEARTAPQNIILDSREQEGYVSGSSVTVSYLENNEKLPLQEWFVQHREEFPEMEFSQITIGNEKAFNVTLREDSFACQESDFVASGAFIYKFSFCNTSESFREKNAAYFNAIMKTVNFMKNTEGL